MFPDAPLAAHQMGTSIYEQSTAYGASFGFTQTEVENMLRFYQISEKMEEMKKEREGIRGKEEKRKREKNKGKES